MSGVFFGSYNPKWGSKEDYSDAINGNMKSDEKAKKSWEKFKEDSTYKSNLRTKGVDNHNWSVRLLSNGGIGEISRKDSNPKISTSERIGNKITDFHGHAVILVEGYDVDLEFKWVADLIVRGEATVRVRQYPSQDKNKTLKNAEEDLKQYQHKSARWIRPAAKIIKMMKKINNEALKKEKVYFDKFAHTKFSTPVQGEKFSYLSDNPYFQKTKGDEDDIPHQWNYTKTAEGYCEQYEPDNCLSWAARKLRMLDIELPININTLFPSIPSISVGSFNQGNMREDESLKQEQRPFKNPYQSERAQKAKRIINRKRKEIKEAANAGSEDSLKLEALDILEKNLEYHIPEQKKSWCPCLPACCTIL